MSEIKADNNKRFVATFDGCTRFDLTPGGVLIDVSSSAPVNAICNFYVEDPACYRSEVKIQASYVFYERISYALSKELNHRPAKTPIQHQGGQG